MYRLIFRNMTDSTECGDH